MALARLDWNCRGATILLAQALPATQGWTRRSGALAAMDRDRPRGWAADTNSRTPWTPVFTGVTADCGIVHEGTHLRHISRRDNAARCFGRYLNNILVAPLYGECFTCRSVHFIALPGSGFDRR